MTKKTLILIVDDEPPNQSVLANTLKQGGYSIILADNGMQALDVLKTKKPQLILLDIMMPGMDGFEVCQKIKEEPSTANIPVIFLTAHNESENVVKGFQLGAVDYVTKPFNSDELITRVHTHLKLKATEEALKESNATKDKFFSIIAHDLGNLFNGLIGVSRLLADHDIPADNTDEFLQIILRSSENGFGLLQNLLEWSRIQTGKLQAHPISLNLEFVVNHTIQLLQNQAEQKKITILCQIKETSVIADEYMLHTVIRNLLSNAIKFTPENGQIEFYTEKTENQIEISIKDSGVGIKSADIDKIFRIDESHSTKGTDGEKGTGLGLMLCKEFVEKNGGTIGVESDFNKGSRFYIRFNTVTKKQ
ncbi:MAG: hybrid sensor histidine kinase/response regulator [Thiomargarita sp.]|nr:hybrid sensor histidine kinase/response regulator [Thiomargarita sp.]